MAFVGSLSFEWIVNSSIEDFQTEMQGQSREVIMECKRIRGREKNRIAQCALRQRHTDLVADLEMQLAEKRRRGSELKEMEDRAKEEYDELRKRADREVDEIVRSQGLDNQIYTIDVAGGNFDIVRRVAEPFLQTGGYGMQEDSFREGDM